MNTRSGRRKSGNCQLAEFFNISHFNFMKNTTFKYKAIVVGSLLLRKNNLCLYAVFPE
jgi:hypothetical protein